MISKYFTLLWILAAGAVRLVFTLPAEEQRREVSAVVNENTLHDSDESDSHQSKVLRTGHLDINNYWPKGKAIPYDIHRHFRESDGKRIEAALRSIANQTKCITFIRRTNESEYVHFVPGRSPSQCNAQIGRYPGYPTKVLLGTKCLTMQGMIMHEVLHALGMLHEHNRPDRDDYVQILYDNIQPNALRNFDKLPNMSVFGEPYDIESIMHFGPFDYAVPGMPTILPRVGATRKMGQRKALTLLDVAKLNRVYCQV